MGNDQIITMGVDLSLTGTGVIVLRNGEIIHEELIKSKSTKTYVDEVRRIQQIVQSIITIAGGYSPQLVVIEGLAFMARNTTALVQLAGLNYLLRAALVGQGIPFVIVAPSTLKKFVTGKGSGPKDVMMLETFKRWGVTLVDNNVCDAYGLAKTGEALIRTDRKELTKPQQEVIKLLTQQLDTYAKT